VHKKNEYGYLVMISENALISLILASLEAYAIEKKGAKVQQNRHLETYGSIYGQHIDLDDGRTLFRVEMALYDTTARQTKSSVEYSEEAITLKRAALASFWPHLDYLGDFHSHPYDNLQAARSVQGFYLSQGDRQNLSVNWKTFWKKLRYRVGIVVTVAPMERARDNGCGWVGNVKDCLEFTIGNFRLWISASCVFEERGRGNYTESKDSLIELHVPSLTGLTWEHLISYQAQLPQTPTSLENTDSASSSPRPPAWKACGEPRRTNQIVASSIRHQKNDRSPVAYESQDRLRIVNNQVRRSISMDRS
jgi:hypothetical protein